MRILAAGLPPEVDTQLPRRLPGVEVVSCPTWQTQTVLKERGPFQLLVLAADGRSEDAVDVAERVRDVHGPDALKILLAVSDAADVGRRLRIDRVVSPPLSPDHLVRQVAALLGLSVPLLEGPELAVAAPLEAARRREQVVLARRLEILERAVKAYDGGTLSTVLARNGSFEALKLAEALRQRGQEAGAALAEQVSDALDRMEGADTAGHLVERLRRVIEGLDREQEGVPAVTVPRILFVEADPRSVDTLVALARNRGMMAAAAYSIEQALELAREQQPDVVLVDPVVASSWDDLVHLFGELQASRMVVYTERDDQEARLAASRLGAALFRSRPAAPDELLEDVEGLLDRVEQPRPRVLAVDDDEIALAAIQAIFDVHQIECVCLQDPRHFWATFEEMVPDLVVLDFEMPHVSGLELCRMLRNDPTWRSLPILLLTAVTDPSVVAAIYGAGADDYASKPITAEELVGRVINRLARQRQVQQTGDTDATTGLLGRRRFVQALGQFTRGERPTSVAVLGIDCFRDVNVATDFDSGDVMLRWMSGLLQRVLPPSALLARWCSDEFVVALPDVPRDDAAALLEHALKQVRAEVFGQLGGRPLRLSLSAGVGQSPMDGDTAEGLYTVAARAMAHAKKTARGTVVSSALFDTPGWAAAVPDVILVHPDQDFCARLARAVEVRGHRVEVLADARTALNFLVQSGLQRPGLVLVLDLDARNVDAWGLLRTFGRTRTAETARVIALMQQTSPEMTDEAFSLGAWYVVDGDVQFPLLVQRVREALSA